MTAGLNADLRSYGYKAAPGGLMYVPNPHNRHLFTVHFLNDQNLYINLAIDAQREIRVKSGSWPLPKDEMLVEFSGIRMSSGQLRFRLWLIGQAKAYLAWKRDIRARQQAGQVTHELGRYTRAGDWKDCTPVWLWCTSRNLESFGLGTSDSSSNIVSERPHERRGELVLRTLENLDAIIAAYAPGYTPPKPPAPAEAGTFSKGEGVLIEWEGSWYPGVILAVRPNGKYRIRYDDHSSDWDEDVPASRLKRP